MSREMQTKRGGDRHRAEQKAEEAKVSGKQGEQMEQGPYHFYPLYNIIQYYFCIFVLHKNTIII